MTDKSAAVSNIVYDSLKKADQAAPLLAPIPSFELYKVAREEELIAYRLLRRVLFLHHGEEPPKIQQRLLEDIAEVLCISAERQDTEGVLAAQDRILLGIRSSGVLKRRGDFTDGIDELNVESAVALAPQDDGHTAYLPALKTARAEAAEPVAARTVMNTKRRGSANAAVAKLGKEIEAAAKSLLAATSPHEEQQLIETLEQKRESLQQLRQEVFEV